MAGYRYRPALLPINRPIDHDLGHYARKGWTIPPGSSRSRPQLLRSSDPTKDQNYYLSAIPEEGLERALFPLGELTKADVRKIAEAASLPTAQRDESMGICFVGQKRKFNEFLCVYTSLRPVFFPLPPFALRLWPLAVDYLEPKPGPIYELGTGKPIGTHKGLWTYTIGQGARLPGLSGRYFIASKNKKMNAIYAVNGS